VIRTKGRHERPADAEKVYPRRAPAVEREFRISRSLRLQVTLVLGADKDGVYWGPRELRLTKWDPFLFA
jgi:hypothetical protein